MKAKWEVTALRAGAAMYLEMEYGKEHAEKLMKQTPLGTSVPIPAPAPSFVSTRDAAEHFARRVAGFIAYTQGQLSVPMTDQLIQVRRIN
jgi:hypothetical protein